MGDKWDAVHQAVLYVLAELEFGEAGLRGDARERLLREWYEKRKAGIEQAIEMELYQPPVALNQTQTA